MAHKAQASNADIEPLSFSVMTLFPRMFDAISEFGISGRALESGLIKMNLYNLRDYAEDKHRTVDARPYGGGPGMVMMAPVLKSCLAAAKVQNPGARVVYLSPQGQRLDQNRLKTLYEQRQIILVCGRYKGIDERFVSKYVDEAVSLGDFVISGGELAAMVLIDALGRLLPGVCGSYDSVQQDSFYEGLLDCPHYTKPLVFEGESVPDVLLSGDHGAIRDWRKEQQLRVTRLKRPDLLRSLC